MPMSDGDDARRSTSSEPDRVNHSVVPDPGPAGLEARPAEGLTDSASPRPRSPRLPALDGLGGVAALVVVV
jgi:hypothetical protein